MRLVWHMFAFWIIWTAGLNLRHAWGWPFELAIGIVGTAAILNLVFEKRA